MKFISFLVLLGGICLSQQPNQPTASLFFGGVAGPPYPITANLNGATFQMDVGGLPNQPFLLYASNSGNLAPGSIIDPIGRVDLDLAQGITPVLDGLNPRNFLDNLAVITGTGFATFVLPIANAGVVGSFQAAVVDPTSPRGGLLTAASRVTITQNALFDLNGGDDTVNQVPLSFGSTNFYGFAYSEVFISANGNVTLGGADGDFQPSLARFDAGFPRIAPLWTDLLPATTLNNQPFIGTFTEDVTGWTFTWTQMANYTTPGGATVTPTGGNTFSVTYAYTANNASNPTGAPDAIIFDYTTGNTTFAPAIPGGLTANWGLIGIGPGGTFPLSPADPTQSSPLDPAPAGFNPLVDPNGVGGPGLAPLGPLTSYSVEYATAGSFPLATYSGTGRVIAFYPLGNATDYVLY